VLANLMIRCEVEDNGDGTYSVSYVPSSDPHQQMFLDISLDGRQLGGKRNTFLFSFSFFPINNN
jgi:hypothetical protein